MKNELNKLTLSIATSAILLNSAYADITITGNSGVGTVTTGNLWYVTDYSPIYFITGSDVPIVLAGSGNITLGSTNMSGTLSSDISDIGGLTKAGTGILTLGGSNTYSGGTIINGGTLILNGGNAIVNNGVVTVNASGTLQVDTAETVGTLSGTGNIILNDILTTGGNNTDATLGGIISGTGGLTKSGTGTLTLSGTNTYTGATTISAGTLSVTGDSHTSAFTANSGGTLSGNGTLGNTTINNGGFLAPSGTSTLNVTGNVVMNAGSTLNINAYANGTNSKVVSNGTASINGGTVAVHADSAGTWNTSTDYTILTATGGVTGTFTSVTDDLSFLTATLSYDASNVRLNLTRNATTYASKGGNNYSNAVGTILDGLGTPNAQMQTLIDVLNGTNDAGAARMLAQLSGAPLGQMANLSPTQIRTFATSLYNRMSGTSTSGGIGLASLAFADNGDMAQTFRYLANAGAIGPNGFQEPQKIGDAEMWIRAVGGRTMNDGDASRNLANSTTTSGGLQAGIDKRNDDWLIGGSVGYLRSNTDQSGMDGKTDSYQFGLYAAQEGKEHRLSFNTIVGHYNNHTARTTPTGTANGDYTGMAVAAEVKAAYKYPINEAWSMEPAIGGWVQRYAQEGYAENGATGSNLAIDKTTLISQALTTELKVIHTFGESKADKGRFETAIGYTRESGDINAALVGRFAASPSAGSFNLASANRGRDVLNATLGGDITVAAHTRLFALVNGNWRENESGYNAMAGVKIGF